MLGVFFGAAMVMAQTVSPLLGLAMIPLYLAYHAIENYVIGPACADHDAPDNVAILIALALRVRTRWRSRSAARRLPIAAVYPSVERFWLRSRLERKSRNTIACAQSRPDTSHSATDAVR